MDLMDWKELESASERQISDSEKQIEISHIMLKEAKKNIKRLNGKTNEEIKREEQEDN